ncbi:MAG: ABC transporter permease [Candidatus Omnitrophica bacterium]|nr:ABC transporter permease [Candidatus Omnitrophota bacterium]
MNALAVKEIRLLLPAYGMALVLAIVPVWLLPTDAYSTPAPIALYAFCFGAAMLALSTFGREFSLRTLPLLLTQPLGRQRLWRTKVAVLTGALVTVFGVWAISCAVCVAVGRGRPDWLDILPIGGPLVVAIFAGGLWTALLLRQVMAAYWFTLLVPGAIAMVVLINRGSSWVVAVVLVLYSIAGFWWGRRLFLRAQSVAWTGGTVALPGWRTVSAAPGAATRVWRPLRALCAKELQLHQVNLMGMAALFLVHLGVLFLRKAGQYTYGEMIGTAVDLFGLIWLFVPLVVGGLSIADERRLGTMDTHLCLPVSSRAQFAVKLSFVVVLGGLLSAVLLFIAEGIGTAMGARSSLPSLFSGSAHIALTLILVYLSLVAFYASTFTRSLLQALAAAVVLGIFFIILMSRTFQHPVLFGSLLWNGNLVKMIGWPVLLATLVCLAYRNFRRRSESPRLWRDNLLGVTASLVLIAGSTTAVYHRVWEFFTPLEPPPGPVRLTGSKPATLQTYGYAILALLPDGRLWEDRAIPGWRDLEFGKSVFGESSWIKLNEKWTNLTQNPFAGGTNWVEAVANSKETLGLRSDGTLWVSEKPRGQFFADGGSRRRVSPPNPLLFPADGVRRNEVPAISDSSWCGLVRKPTGCKSFGTKDIPALYRCSY